MNTDMIIVVILVLRFLVKLRFPASTPISASISKKFENDGYTANHTNDYHAG